MIHVQLIIGKTVRVHLLKNGYQTTSSKNLRLGSGNQRLLACEGVERTLQRIYVWTIALH